TLPDELDVPGLSRTADGDRLDRSGWHPGPRGEYPGHILRPSRCRANRVGAGPYRGPGGPQTAFELETPVDELAGRLDIDPLEIRLRNVADEGSPMNDGEPWPAIGVRECLAQVALDPLWLNRRALPPGDGVGLAAGVWPGSKDAAAAMCRVEPDGTVTVVTGMVDMTGTAGAFEAIAAEAMGR